MRLWQRSIQWQLILSMGTALLVSVLTVVGISFVVAKRLAERALVGEAMPASVAAIGNDVERMLAGPLAAARGIAGNSMVEDWLASGEDPAQQAAFVRYLQGVKTDQQAMTTFIVAAGSGHYFTDRGLDRTLQRGQPDDGWFYSLVDGNAGAVMQVDIDKSTHVPTLFIDERVARDGKPLGVAGLGFSLEAMSQLIRNFRFGEQGKVFLVSRDGRIKVHPQADYNDTRSLGDLVGEEAARTLLAGNGQAVAFARDGESYLALAKPLKSLDWLLVSEVPAAQVYGAAHQALLLTCLAGVGIALLSLLLVVVLARGLVRPIRQVTAALVEIGGGGGDLTRRLDDRRQDELGDLARGFNRFVGGQRQLIGGVLGTSERLRDAVSHVARVIEDTAGRAGQQRQMTDMVATAVHEMGLTVQEIARNASDAARASESARSEAGQARQVVGQSVEHIERMSGEIGGAAQAVGALAEQVASIDQVLAVIRGISEQTNLLALNAAIEAARAGEMGRGFAVVADEVRTLASRTQASTDEIQQMIGRLKQGAETAVGSMRAGQAATGVGVEASRQAGRSLGAIGDQIDAISDMNGQVATATEEQTSVTEEINRNVQGIADLAQATANEVEECHGDCAALRGLADDLARQMGQFRL